MASGGKYHNYGLLILRLGIGAMFIYDGAPKLFRGPAVWGSLGRGTLGISHAPQFWGFLAALFMFAGGMCLIAGFLFRPCCAVLLAIMAVATGMHWSRGSDFHQWRHAFEMAIILLSLFLIGPGDLNLVARIRTRRK